MMEKKPQLIESSCTKRDWNIMKRFQIFKQITQQGQNCSNQNYTTPFRILGPLLFKHATFFPQSPYITLYVFYDLNPLILVAFNQ